MELEKYFELQTRCLNDIDDFLEYQWKKYSRKEIRDKIMDIIDEYTRRCGDV